MSGTTTARLGLFGRIALFVRQVLAELKKVVWPTREQLGTYTLVVIVFVTILALLVSALDLGFTRLVLTVFG
jgi:preprotein translocase subunit SecE